MNVKKVIFDLGGLLVEWNPQKIVESFTPDYQLQSILITQIFQHSDWLELDRGSITEREAARRMSCRLELPESIVFGVFDTVRQSFTAIDETLGLLNWLIDQGIPCYGLTNMSTQNYEYLVEKHAFFKL